jgi:hypothetical protein
MRKNIFTGAHATRERIAFRDFIKKHFPDKIRVINDKISDLVFADADNNRTSKLMQRIFVEIYEFYIKGNEHLEEALLSALKVRYDKNKAPAEVLNELVENLKTKGIRYERETFRSS